MVLSQRLAMRLAAFTPSPLILGHTDNQSSLTDRDIYFEQTRYRHRAFKRTRLPYHRCKHHTIQIRNKLMKVQWPLTNDIVHSRDSSARVVFLIPSYWGCAFLHWRLNGNSLFLPLYRDCLLHVFFCLFPPIRAFAFASPSARNLPQLFAWLSPSHSCGFY